MDKLKNKLKKYIAKVFKAFNKMEMRILPGNVAFFFVLALIPIITIIIYIASYFSLSINTIIDLINSILPKDASTIVINAISGKDFDRSIGVFSLFTLVIASNGTYAIISASNTLYKIKNTDPLKDRIKSLILLNILLLLIIFLLLVPMFGGKILSLFHSTRLIKDLTIIYNLIRWPLTFFLIYLNLKLIYTIAPSNKIESKTTTYGALFTTIIWTIATAIFSYYLQFFANYNIIYGNLSSIIILMIWIYLISYVFVLGIAINAVNMEDMKKDKISEEQQ